MNNNKCGAFTVSHLDNKVKIYKTIYFNVFSKGFIRSLGTEL